MQPQTVRFPQSGRQRQDIFEEMQSQRSQDVQWQQGRVFSLVFYAGEELSDLTKAAYNLFFSENALNPTAFPSLRKFETEVVAMAADLLHGDEQVVGNMTSGGTESILMAVKTAREWARHHRPHVSQPEILMPVSAHPAFEKAAEYFSLRAVRVPVGPNYAMDIQAMRKAITPNTILMVGSAPSYPHGIVDCIEQLSQLAIETGLLLHVDACVGGFMLPFVRKLGYPVPTFDFSLPGVTSISADLHKYGYAAKGASLILYRNPELRRNQFYVYTDWPGGIYVSPTMTGTRPGGAIAAAWAVMNFLGEDGYTSLAGQVMQAVEKYRQGIQAIPGLSIIGDPQMSILAITSERLNIYEIGDEMSRRGWHLDRQQFPASLHLTINAAHIHVVDEFLSDLRESALLASRPTLAHIQENLLIKFSRWLVKILPPKLSSRLTALAGAQMGGNVGGRGRTSAMYGLIGSLPNRGDLKELVLDLLDGLTRLPNPQSKSKRRRT